MPSSPNYQLDPIKEPIEDNDTPAATELVSDTASSTVAPINYDTGKPANDEEKSPSYSGAHSKNDTYRGSNNKQINLDGQNSEFSEFKVAMTSLSPNVVIAAVEPETDDIQSDSTIIEDIEAAILEGETLSDSATLADEPKIILTSPSPDVVIATVEDTKSETAQTYDSEIQADTPVNSQFNHSSVDIKDKDSSSVFHDAAKEANKSHYNVEPTSEDYLATETEDDDEEIKEVKEAKLESYKQFIARQFSNQKIDYPEVRVTIEANALPNRMYFVMNILSAIIASYGLVINSAAVVIGAMLVAMMLGPITGIALAIIDYRLPLLRKSLITVTIGISLVVVVGFVVGWLHKDQPLTAEILSRTQPTSMDLMIALAGGTAGAYAMVSPHLSVAVVGVAVATALVPPLAASGILFANGELQLGLGALLLAITNIIAIQFTNAMVLWFLGFRRLVDDDYKTSTFFTFLRRNAVTLLLLIGLGSYLTINLNKNARQQTFESTVKEVINSYFSDKGNVLTNTQFDTTGDNQIVRAIIRGETTPSSYDVQQIEATITEDMAANFPSYLPIKIQLRYLPVQVIEANPLTADKLDRTDAAILTN